MKVLLALVALTLVTACSTTQNTTQAPKTEELELAQISGNESLDEEKQVYCTREAMIGTRLPQRRICRTKEEWRIITETSKEAMDELQRQPAAIINN